MPSRSSFTLIELLLVIGIIVILASIVIVAINPAKSLSEARDEQRRSDVNSIANAVGAYALDNSGKLPAGIPKDAPKIICQPDVPPADCETAFSGVSLNALFGIYLTDIPRDPQVAATGTGTRYTIIEGANGSITVAAPGAERAENISVTR
ncbi:type II secretion system protein [Candidatus Peregrinibacteria bacterium]|nr:type II secretion system protein [Candidatus Peregrinibacteria bacterium]